MWLHRNYHTCHPSPVRGKKNTLRKLKAHITVWVEFVVQGMAE
jgi:hypothetical protein